MNNDADLLASLKAIASGSAQLRAFELALKQQTQAITDLLARIAEKESEPAPEKEEGPDRAAAMVEAVRALLPPQVNVTPTLTTAPGAAWAVEGTGADGRPFKLKITKL